MFRSFLHCAPRSASSSQCAIGLAAVLALVEAAPRGEKVEPRLLQDSLECSERSGQSYGLTWAAQGSSFFDEFDFQDWDENNGAAQYLSASDAFENNVVEAHDTHAILRVGKQGSEEYKRFSAKIATKQSWKYYLMAMRYSHLPWGCSVWPSFWTTAADMTWPQGGELDILEWVHNKKGFSSFHADWDNRCTLHWDDVNRPGCPEFGIPWEGLTSECQTVYPFSAGCAPNRQPDRMAQDWAENPGVVAVEWTSEFLKVFYIPEGEIPGDLYEDAPRPDEWDRWLFAYYPFAAAERRSPGSCPKEGGPLEAQQLIFNIGMCGDWASKEWPGCWAAPEPTECRTVDVQIEGPHPEEDCCTQFVWDEANDDYLTKTAYFNISWVKVYQSQSGGDAMFRRSQDTSKPNAPKSIDADLARLVALLADADPAPREPAWALPPGGVVVLGVAGWGVLAALLAGAWRQRGPQGDDAQHMLVDPEGPAAAGVAPSRGGA